jgi:hypothetical protein
MAMRVEVMVGMEGTVGMEVAGDSKGEEGKGKAEAEGGGGCNRGRLGTSSACPSCRLSE